MVNRRVVLQRIRKDQLSSVVVNEWSFPDGIATRNIDAQSVQDSIVVTDVLTTKARSSVIEDTKEAMQKMIQRLESMAIVRVDPSKGSAINDGVSQAITKLVEVSHSAFGDLTLIDLQGTLDELRGTSTSELPIAQGPRRTIYIITPDIIQSAREKPVPAFMRGTTSSEQVSDW